MPPKRLEPPYKLKHLLTRNGTLHGGACGGERLRPLLAFAVVGVQKSGTTGLASHLAHHPQLCVEPEARLMRKNWSTPGSAIAPENSECGSRCARLVGLDDPGGAFSFAFAGGTHAPSAAGALAAMAARRLPLVLLLREPIQRAFSAFSMIMALPPSGNRRRYDSFDLCVFLETRWVAGLTHGGLPHGSPPVPARLNAFQSPMEYVRLGLYAEMLDPLFAAGYTRWEGDGDEEGRGGVAAAANTMAGAPPQLLILVSERLHANESAGRARLWRFLGVPPAATTSSFDRPGSYRANLTSWARRRLWHVYRNSTRRTYAHLGGAVPEWEAYYTEHDASAHAEPHPQHLVDATTAPRRAALRKTGGGAQGRANDRSVLCYSAATKTREPCGSEVKKPGGGTHGRAMRDDRPQRCYSADKTWEPCEVTRAAVMAPWVGDPI